MNSRGIATSSSLICWKLLLWILRTALITVPVSNNHPKVILTCPNSSSYNLKASYTSLQIFLCTKPLYHCWWRCSYISISSGAQYMTLKTYFSHASLVIYYLETPPIIKLKLGVQQICGGLLIANHVEPIIMIDQSEILSSSTRINLLHSFHGSQSCCGRLLPATTKTVQLCGAKTIFLIQTRIFFFWLFFNQSYCAGSSHSEHHWRRSYFMSFAMEHMKDSHLWWFYVFFFCTKLWILP